MRVENIPTINISTDRAMHTLVTMRLKQADGEAIVLAVHGLDLVVCSFERAGRERVVIPIQDSLLVFD